MRCVDQTKFFAPGESRGNCQQAAVASILGLELDDVPNFSEGGGPVEFWEGYYGFLRERGLIDIQLPPNHAPDCYYLAYGPSSRGVSHAVVYFDGKLAHDPHPSREGLVSVREIHLIVPVDVALAITGKREAA